MNQRPTFENALGPLGQAAMNGHFEIVKLLIEAGADVDQRSDGGMTAFFVSCSMGHANIARLLEANGANVQLTITGGATALLAAVGLGHVEVVRYLLTESNYDTSGDGNAILAAESFGNEEIMRLFREAGLL